MEYKDPLHRENRTHSKWLLLQDCAHKWLLLSWSLCGAYSGYLLALQQVSWVVFSQLWPSTGTRDASEHSRGSSQSRPWIRATTCHFSLAADTLLHAFSFFFEVRWHFVHARDSLKAQLCRNRGCRNRLSTSHRLLWGHFKMVHVPGVSPDQTPMQEEHSWIKTRFTIGRHLLWYN